MRIIPENLSREKEKEPSSESLFESVWEWEGKVCGLLMEDRSMESVNYKSLEEANNLLNQDDLPSSNSKAPRSPSPSKRSRSQSPKKLATSQEEEEGATSPLKNNDNLNGHNNYADSKSSSSTTVMECGAKKLVIIAALCCKWHLVNWAGRGGKNCAWSKRWNFDLALAWVEFVKNGNI